ncbi:MAG: MMPL family transporter, partial [Acidimicrobiales bacterium]|nr:MMPL family transporter [Acidimicrobiales bacterium]
MTEVGSRWEVAYVLARLSQVLIRRRRLVWVGAILFVIVAGAFGAGVQEHLSTGGLEDPGAESTRAAKLLRDDFNQQEPNLVMVLTAKDGTVDDAANAQAGSALTQKLGGEEYISFAGSYWTLFNAPPLKSGDGTQAMLLARVKGTDDEVDEQIEGIVEEYAGDQGALDVSITGMGPVFHEVGTTIEEDLRKAETIALGVTVILLIFVFGGLVAASLPLIIGIIAIVGSWLALRIIASITDVSVYVISMTTVMGLGLAIDYSLFVLSRFREELANGHDVPTAVTISMKTAGRTVIFSALTVAVSLSALL